MWSMMTLRCRGHVASGLLLPLLLSDLAASVASPAQVGWSSATFGPDGPWQAVSITIGSSSQALSLYPGAIFASSILTAAICDNVTLSPVCYASAGGLYDTSSTTLDNHSISPSAGPPGNGLDAIHTDDDSAVPYGMDDIAVAGIVISNVSLRLVSSAWTTYPDGSSYPLTLGTIAIGGPAVNQTFGYSDGRPSINASLIAGFFASSEAPSNHRTASNSYGLHIGAVQPRVPASLWLGGYDQTRVLGPVSTQAGTDMVIDLLDISFQVATGASPLSYRSKTGLLAEGNNSLSPALPVTVQPLAPYLYLPPSVCAAITADLPVTFQSKYGLYFWNTSDPLTATLISSPAYLAFTFRLSDSNSANVSVNVPFSLLNLTLTAPLIDTPTPYFPCFSQPSGNYGLGRAFLQAAFMGINWDAGDSGVWWLAQAPGPNTPSQPAATAILPTDTSILTSDSTWQDSWSGSWVALASRPATLSSSPTSGPTSSSTSHPTSTSRPSSLSTGAKAGIGIGAAGAGLAALVAALWFCWRSRQGRSKTDSMNSMQPLSQGEAGLGPDAGLETSEAAKYERSGFGPAEVAAEEPMASYEVE